MKQAMTVSWWLGRGVEHFLAAIWRRGSAGVLAVLVVLLLPLGVRALGPGDLDASFGGDGKVLTDFGGSGERTNALAIQLDGKIVAAGYSGARGHGDFALARYLPNGTLDTTFGDDGLVLTDFRGGSQDFAVALAIQPGGKLVMAGAVDGDFALARYLPNGTLDTTFGDDGLVLTNFGTGSFEAVNSLALQSDGKIVVAGSSSANGSDDFALVRYLPNGTLDTTFGDDGLVLTNFGTGSQDFPFALALQPDGKIVVAGLSEVGGNRDVALARYGSNGSLDTTFSGDGKVLTDFGSGSHDEFYALIVQPRDGRLVVAGESFASSGGDFALARYHAITCGGVVVTRVGTAGNDTISGWRPA